MVERPLSREAFAATIDVSRETLDRLTVYLDLLRRWQRAINLVGPATLADPWRRHILDSAQLAAHLPSAAGSLVDLGSGAGLPGMVLALLGVPGVHLIESDPRKAQFLREVARTTGASVVIHAERIEHLAGWPADVITARALAPLPRLLTLAERFLTPATVCLFLKGGATIPQELTDAAGDWHMVPEMFPSLSAPSGIVLKLREVGRARDRQPKASAARPRDGCRQPEGRGR
jgi:16S rRNA (guanine527-N7)-methyltransferase